jgi:hypothetical protein
MADVNDPSFHQAAEREMIEHVARLLDDPRLVVDTSGGRRAVTTLVRDVKRSDRGVELKRLMSDLNVPDRALQERMPSGQVVDVALSAKRFWILRKPVGQLRVVCVSPSRELLRAEPGKPITAAEVEQLMRSMPPPVAGVPLTVVLVSTSGFTIESRLCAERTAHRTLILAEPNGAGGWSVHGPQETRALVELFDPEAEDRKRARVRAEIEACKVDLLTGGVASDKIATRLQLPLQLVEGEVRSFARDHAGLAATRIDGRVILYRAGSTPAPTSASPEAGGSGMPLIDRIKSLFSRKGETEKKVAFLSERRAALSQQRERAYEEIHALEQKDGELREQFKQSRAPLTKRRITSQLVQLQKDMERRQQMIQVLNQQVNVVSTHLHNLELSKQGQVAQLPDSEEIASDAAAAEEMLANLQADSELADSVGATPATAGMSEEEQALYEELEREASGAAPSSGAEPQQNIPAATSTPRVTEPSRTTTPPAPAKRAEPEAG